MKRASIPLTVLGGGMAGMLLGAGFGLASDGCGGPFIFGGIGFGMGLVVGSIVGVTWLALATLQNSVRPGGPAADYDDAPPEDR